MSLLLLVPFAYAVDTEAIAEALRVRDCGRAITLAEGWTEEAPRDAAAWRRLGDAHRCARLPGDAVRDYRRAIALGDRDPELPKLIEIQSRGLGTVTLELGGLPPGVTPVPRLKVGTSSWAQDEGGFDLIWTAVPVGAPMVLSVVAPGLEPVDVSLPPLADTETRPVRVRMKARAAATVRVTGWDAPGLRVSLVQDGQDVMVTNDEVSAFVGPAVVRIASKFGDAEVPVVLGGGQVPSVDVGDHVPGQVALDNLPVGSSVRFDGRVIAPAPNPEPALFDDRLGIEVKSERFPGVPGGRHALEIVHPLLGAQTVAVDVLGGRSAPVKVALDAFPRTAELVGWRDAWREADASIRRPSGKVIAAGVGFFVAAGGAVGGAVVWSGQTAELADTRGDYQALVEAGDAEGARTVYGAIGDARRGRRAPMVAAVGAAGLGAAALGAGVVWQVQFGKTHPRPTWDPAKALGVAEADR